MFAISYRYFGSLAFTFFFLAGCHVAKGADFLIVGSDYVNSGENRFQNLRNRVLTGMTNYLDLEPTVDIFDAGYGTPSLDLLMQYDAVLLWSGGLSSWSPGIQDRAALGNVMADYVDAGRGVTVMSLQSVDGPTGRWASQGYDPMIADSYEPGLARSLGVRHDPAHSIFLNVTNVTTVSRDKGSVRPGAKLIASYDGAEPNVPFASESNGFSGRVLNLNFYPSYVGPNQTGDIELIIANALYYVALPGTPVPEASTYAICGASLVMLTLAGRRCRNRR